MQILDFFCTWPTFKWTIKYTAYTCNKFFYSKLLADYFLHSVFFVTLLCNVLMQNITMSTSMYVLTSILQQTRSKINESMLPYHHSFIGLSTFTWINHFDHPNDQSKSMMLNPWTTGHIRLVKNFCTQCIIKSWSLGLIGHKDFLHVWNVYGFPPG